MEVPLHPLADQFLSALGVQPDCAELEIGGGVALWHYLPYRGTNDVDLWWSEPTAEAREAISGAAAELADSHGLTLAHRAQAGYESWDLKRDGKTVLLFRLPASSTASNRPFRAAGVR